MSKEPILVDKARIIWQTDAETVGKWWKRNGFYCFVRRIPFLFGRRDKKLLASEGHLCGYVNIPPSCLLANAMKKDDFDDIRVHGGVTYYQRWADGTVTVGFDTKHAMDYDPLITPEGHKWTVEEMREETNSLADQIDAKSKGDWGLGALFG